MTPTTGTPDVLGIRIAHRAMRGDVRRLAVTMAEVAGGRQPCDQARAAAIAGFVTKLCESIHHHHTTEDTVMWPVLERSAGAEVDLSDLTDDHAELDPLLNEVHTAAVAFMTDRSQAHRLAAVLATLADLLDGHIEEEERTLFPIIEKYVSTADWLTVETAARKGSSIGFELPRIGQYATPEELAELRKLASPILYLMLTLMRGPHRRRQRLIFGSPADVPASSSQA
ncbi:hemerythrin domain-containing protein [Sphaerisporangium perillae]|uniref:hemerythrin domain-containing protein n=1 Tax=Sphaerisporangium perillae TaxID=2935860 RepID=UPI00200C61B2|nr:hemerythrin domain-containing protein [Sphaerisporangium perillae]